MTAETQDWRKLTREQQVLIFAIAQLDDLKAAGHMIGGHLTSSPKSRAALVQMQAEGFRPTAEELTTALTQIDAHYQHTHGKHRATRNDEGADTKTTGDDPR